MTRHGVAFTILALFGLALTIPDPSLARGPSFRPAFTGGPFRIVVPTGRPHGHIGPRIGSGRPAFTLPARSALPGITPHPIARSAALGAAPFRVHRRGFRGSPYPVTTYGGDSSFYGTPYDPSDIPVYGPAVVAADDAAPAFVPRLQAATPERGCRAEQVTVPNAGGRGESPITIVRC